MRLVHGRRSTWLKQNVNLQNHPVTVKDFVLYYSKPAISIFRLLGFLFSAKGPKKKMKNRMVGRWKDVEGFSLNNSPMKTVNKFMKAFISTKETAV